MSDDASKKTVSSFPVLPGPPIFICLSLLDDIQKQIRYADSKAGFISMLNVFLFGFIATNFEKLRTLCESGKSPAAMAIVLTVGVVMIYLLFTVASFVLVVTSVTSRFAQRGPESKVFFGHIAKNYGAEPEKYAEVICKLSDSEWVRELANQITEISALAILKHRRIRWATMTTLASVLLWLVALVTIVGVRWLSG